MAVSPCTALCSADARAATRSTSTGSLRSATNAQRLSFAGTLVRVLEPPVKDGVNQVRMHYGFMSWSTGHGLITMLELHSLSVIHGKYICNKELSLNLSDSAGLVMKSQAIDVADVIVRRL
jgi:hypothetical protein